MYRRIKTILARKKVLVAACVLLLLTNVATLGFWQYQTVTTKSTRDYPFIDVARDSIAQEHFIVNIQPLREKMRALVEQEPDQTVSIYFEFLNSGANIQINNEAYFYPASLVKLPTAMVAMKKIEDGVWKPDNRLVLFEKDKDARYGTLHEQPIGTSFTIHELLQKLLVDSDNTAHHILMRNMTESELDALKDAIGLDDLFNEKSEVSAKEYSRLFRALYNSSFLSRDNSQQILQWLAETSFTHSLPSGVPADTIFSHKIGEDDVERNYLDSGIVYLPNRPYLLTVMIKQHDKAAAQALMRQISKDAYDYVSQYK